ncbi:MAG: polyribonucleotide nucleotidyltransferase [Candidatus Marinimicrobia bacterium]|nr:polyribonucleotide nucleotidyltransferase [Candidatus Neomarinimicrobiota bacterium]
MNLRKEIEFGGRKLVLETGNLAKQASGSCLVTYGETMLLVAATASKGVEEDRGFFPLSVEYREKYYASGKIPGGFFKREARPSEKEILASRLTDRPLRPLFADGFNNETRLDINVISYDEVNEPDVFAALGSSFALSLSDIPFNGPIASVRVGRIDDKLIMNPTKEQMESSDFDLVLSGNEESIVMVEGKCEFVSEEDILTAIQYGHEGIKELVKFQKDILSEMKITKRDLVIKDDNVELQNAVDKLVEGKISNLNDPKDKHSRYSDVDNLISTVVESLETEFPDMSSDIKSYIDKLVAQDLRSKTIRGKRADGRDLKTVRDITVSTSLLPRSHGSATFTRGETQALVAATLGGKRDEQMIDSIEGLSYKRVMLHYNFPSFCVGEARGKFSLSRREVGHGNLAERAITPTLPSFEEFPYTIRLVSEILESNGSSSMASVCGSSLALMDAGVPVKSPIAGVAMGLIMDENGKYAILTDILGTEDHIGDMDFKVAGSKDGITAIQMDIKIDGLSYDILSEALQQAKDGRIHILNEMNKSINKHRDNLSVHAPKIGQISMPTDMIGAFIGPGGKNIKALAEQYEVEINVEEDGSATVLGLNQDNINSVLDYVKSMTYEPKAGDIINGEVVRILDFGAFVKISPTKDGLVHISEIKNERVEKVTDCLNIGDKVDVKIIKVDDAGKISLSMKALLKK